MAYVDFTGSCDICGKKDTYVKYYYDHDINGEIINDRMECIDCADKRVKENALINYDTWGKGYLEYKEAHKEENLKTRAEIEQMTKEFLEKRRG
jgi:C4-type Zn-finger protein